MKFLRDRIRSILQIDEPPKRLASAFALGVFIAFTPTIGLHTISCLLLAWMFRLSKLVVLTAAFLNNPWTIVPLYGFCLWFGIKITGSAIEVPRIEWSSLTFTTAYELLKPYAWSFVAGTVILGTIAALLSYVIIYWALMKYRRGEAAASEGQGGGN